MRAQRVAAIAAALVLAASLAACGGDSSSTPQGDPAPSAQGTGSSSTPQAATDDPARSEPVEDSVYPDAGDPSVDALSYQLDLSWEPKARRLTGHESLRFRSTETSDHVQLDLSQDLEAARVEIDGEKAEFSHDGKDLVVQGDFAADVEYVLTLNYSGRPQPVPAPTTRSDFTTTGFTVSDDGSAWTMQEPYGAYTWYAVNDQPADKAFYDFVLTVPAPWTGIANGELTSREVVEGKTVTSWHLDSKASSYLVTVAFGNYQAVKDTSASGVALTYWTKVGTPKAYVDSLRATKDALAWVEGKLGPYPFPSLGILLVDSQSGMETQTMITLGTSDYTTSEAVILHEIVHQWYGDLVTPSDWSDLWMNEGMAMYLQLTWQAQVDAYPLTRLLEQAAVVERESRRVNGPPATYDPRTFGEIQVYYGPALMWDQIRRRVGDDKFWAMVRDWPAADPDGSSDRDDYIAWVEKQTGTELSDLFDSWLLAKRSPRFE